MRIRAIAKWVVAGLLAVPVSLIGGAAALNYTGYCFEQHRYLTSEERILSGVQGVLGHYSAIRFVHDQLPSAGRPVLKKKDDWRGTGSEKGTVLAAEQLVPYGTVEEFFTRNPDCCSFTREGLFDEVGSPSLWDKISGHSAGYVNIKFRVRFRDAEGNEQSQFSASSFNYTNCGRSVPLY